MAKKNEFEKFCDDLSDYKINKADYVRTQLMSKYKDNLDMLLMIKAEAQEDDYMQFLAIRVAILALIASAFGTISSYAPDTGNILIDSIKNIIYLLLLFYAFTKIGIGDKFSSVRKWRKYVLIVIDDLIEECKKTKEDQTKGNKKKHKK